MPNWCCTDVCFRGAPENINKLCEDINSSIKWMIQNKYKYVNLYYFFSLNGLNVEDYLNKYTKRIYLGDPFGKQLWFPLRISFRGSVIESTRPVINNQNETSTIYTTFEIAWNTDYEILSLISTFYNVEFSAYSEEPSMGIFTKCSNCNMENDYDYDIIVSPDYEQAEEVMEKYPDLELYRTPFKLNDPEYKYFIQKLDDNKIEYSIDKIEEINSDELYVYGVYYEPVNGVTYDDVLV